MLKFNKLFNLDKNKQKKQQSIPDAKRKGTKYIQEKIINNELMKYKIYNDELMKRKINNIDMLISNFKIIIDNIYNNNLSENLNYTTIIIKNDDNISNNLEVIISDLEKYLTEYLNKEIYGYLFIDIISFLNRLLNIILIYKSSPKLYHLLIKINNSFTNIILCITTINYILYFENQDNNTLITGFNIIQLLTVLKSYFENYQNTLNNNDFDLQRKKEKINIKELTKYNSEQNIAINFTYNIINYNSNNINILTDIFTSYKQNNNFSALKSDIINKLSINLNIYINNFMFQYDGLIALMQLNTGGSNEKYKKTENKITVIYKKKKYTRVIYINERKKYVKINKTFMLLSKLKKI
jgi:hypothetical protein